MTNEMIIFGESQRLAEEGKIAYTGREVKIDNGDGTFTVVKETEPIHTYAAWLSMGYRVRRGEHAKAQFIIWKHSAREKEDGTQDDRMFMKKASFFTREQVEEVEE